jgi:hypothetical protein
VSWYSEFPPSMMMSPWSNSGTSLLMKSSTAWPAESRQHNTHVKGTGKAIPAQARTGPGGWGSQTFQRINTWTWQGCQPYTLVAITTREASWYSLLLEAQYTPAPQCGRKEQVNEKLQWPHHRNRTHDLSAYSTVPQPAALFMLLTMMNNICRRTFILWCIHV